MLLKTYNNHIYLNKMVYNIRPPKPMTGKYGIKPGDLIDKGLGDLPIADTEEINMNSLYLRLIFDEMVAFVNGSHQQDVNSMYDSLYVIDALISPKVDTSDYNLKLRWIEANIGNSIIKDEEGRPLYYRPQLVSAIKKQLYIVFKIMLKLMSDKGMLTFVQQKPGAAMSKFRSA